MSNHTPIPPNGTNTTSEPSTSPAPIYRLLIHFPKVGLEEFSRDPNLLKIVALGFANHRMGVQQTALEWVKDFEGFDYPIIAAPGDMNFMIHPLAMVEDRQPAGLAVL